MKTKMMKCMVMYLFFFVKWLFSLDLYTQTISHINQNTYHHDLRDIRIYSYMNVSPIPFCISDNLFGSFVVSLRHAVPAPQKERCVLCISSNTSPAAWGLVLLILHLPPASYESTLQLECICSRIRRVLD